MLSNIISLTAGATGTTAKTGIPTIELILGIAIMVAAVVLILAVLFQSSKDKSLSGTISGAGETFFTKSKAKTLDKVLSRVTFVAAIIFAILVVAMYLIVS